MMVERDTTAAPVALDADTLLAKLRRASEVERELGADDPRRQIVQWVREFLARPHADLGRPGPVCPFAPAAIGMDTIWLAEISEANLDRVAIERAIAQYREVFLDLEPRTGTAAMNKAVMVVFPNLGAEGARVVDEIQAELKAHFVDVGLMLGEFHAKNEAPGLRNPDFRPLRSPIPMLVMRNMVDSDLPFLRRSIDPPGLRAAYLRSFIRRLGAVVSRSTFESAIESLVEAELQLRSQADFAGPTRSRGEKPARAKSAPKALSLADDVHK